MTRIYVRVANNMFDDDEFPVHCLELEPGAEPGTAAMIVTRQWTTSPGLQGLPEPPIMVGWTVARIAEWSRYDGTGQTVEECHEVAVPHGRLSLRWDDFLDASRLAQDLEEQE